MKNVSTKGNNIGSENQTGGITAQNVTINNYGPLSRGLGKFTLIFKNKAVKWSTLGAICLGAFFSIKAFSGKQIATKEDFYQFLLNYLQSVDKKDTDASDYFADNISTFYLAKNISPDSINQIRKNSDYKDGRYNIDKNTIIPPLLVNLLKPSHFVLI